MEDGPADKLPLPAKADVVDCAQRAFLRLGGLMGADSDETLLGVMADDPDGDVVAQNVMYHLDHVNRHLGMIEAMNGPAVSQGKRPHANSRLTAATIRDDAGVAQLVERLPSK